MTISDSKLFRLLSTLSEEECKSFEAFLHSPFHQKSRKILDFWALLQPWFPMRTPPAEGWETALDKHRLFAELFPELTYKDSNLSNLMTTMSNLVEAFWVHRAVGAQPWLHTRLLLQAYRDRAGLEADFHRLWKVLEKKWEEVPQEDPEELFFLLSTRQEYLSFQSEHQPRDAAFSLGESLGLLRKFTLVLHLKYYLAALNRQRLVEEEADTSLQVALWHYLDEHPKWAIEPPLRVYVGVIRCLLDPEHPAYYPQTMTWLSEDLGRLPVMEAKTLVYTLLNYLNGRFKAKGQDILPELLNLYRLGYERGLLFSGEYLDAHVFLNILNVATGVIKGSEGDAKTAWEQWRQAFVADNRARLRPDIRDETYSYAQAYLAYQAKDYAVAYQLLSQHKPSDVLADLSRRTLLIRVYYDAWDQDLFDAQVKSALMYISRASSVSEGKRLAYNRFVRLSRMLFGLKGKPISGQKLAAIRADILSPEPLECRQWLTEKVEELPQ